MTTFRNQSRTIADRENEGCRSKQSRLAHCAYGSAASCCESRPKGGAVPLSDESEGTRIDSISKRFAHVNRQVPWTGYETDPVRDILGVLIAISIHTKGGCCYDTDDEA